MESNRPAPNFTLNDLDGNPHNLADYSGGIVIMNFWSAECPHAARVDLSLLPLIEKWGGKVKLLPIAVNATEPLEMLRQVATERDIAIVLHDAAQKVVAAYNAQTTPHIFILDAEGILRYQGAYDDVAFRQRVATRNYVQETVEALLNGSTLSGTGKPEVEDIPPFGCAIIRYSI